MELPSVEAIAARAKDCDILIVNKSINFDHETAVSLADRFCNQEHFFFLESATAGPGSIARYSFLGFDALLQFKSDGQENFWQSKTGPTEMVAAKNPLRALEKKHMVCGQSKWMTVLSISKSRI